MPYNSTPTGPFPSVTPSSTSLSLLQRVKDQDPDAWRRLVRLYGPVVFLWCRRAGLTGPDAADAVQKVWMSVATHLAEFHREPPKDSFRGWLRTITRRKFIDGWRIREPSAIGGSDARRMLDQVPAEIPDSAEQVASDKELLTRRALELIRAGVEDRTWQAFWRTTVDGRPSPEVAAELGMTKKAVRQAKCRVVRLVREELGGMLD